MEQKNTIIIGTVILVAFIVIMGAVAIYYSVPTYGSDNKDNDYTYTNPPIIINKYYGETQQQDYQVPKEPSEQYKQVRVNTYSEPERTSTYNYYNYNYPSYRFNQYHQGYYRRNYYYPYHRPYYHYPYHHSYTGFTVRPPNIYY